MKPRTGCCIVITCMLTASLCAEETRPPTNGDAASKLRDQLARQAAPAKLDPTWYRPHVERKGKVNPVAVILASKDFPVTKDDFWIPLLWKENFCTLVLRTQPPDRWSSIRLTAVLQEIAEAPEEVPADPNRLLLIADTKTGSLALRFVETYPSRIVGVVFISFMPARITPTGPGLWRPRDDVWSIPMWSVVGTRGKVASAVLESWRKFASRAPMDASLCVDSRPDRGMGHLLPDDAVGDWLKSIWAGKRPAPGPDRQVEAERKQFTALADRIRQAVRNGATPLPTGEAITKTDGPFQITVRAPEGWCRDPEGEKTYSLQGPRTDEQGRLHADERNPYAEIYLTPKRRGQFFVRIRAAKGTGRGESILETFEKLVLLKGYLPVNIRRWQDGKWTYDVSTYLRAWEDKWHRWVVLTAVSNDTPAAPLIMVMDSSDTPDPKRMTSALRTITDTIRVTRNPTKSDTP
jgi:hypothetical protein